MSALPTRANLFPAGALDPADAKTYLAALFDFIAQRFARGTTGAGTATATELASARDSLGVPMHNWLLNPDGAVYQRAVAATADDAYMDDRWYALTQTGSITPSQVSNPEDGFRYALRLTQSQAAAQRMGRAQILEGKDTSQLRGKTVTFGGRYKLSTTANLRLALLAWTGTEDSPTSDVVNDWTSSTYTTGNFFVSSNLSLIAASQTALTAATAADAYVSGAVPSNATNLIALYWTEATAAQNVTLDAWGQRLIEAGALNEYVRRDYAEELRKCRRFFFKKGGTAVAPLAVGIQLSTTSCQVQMDHPVEMRATPTLSRETITGYEIVAQTAFNVNSDITLNNASPQSTTLLVSASGSTGSTGQPVLLRSTNASSSALYLSAEL